MGPRQQPVVDSGMPMPAPVQQIGRMSQMLDQVCCQAELNSGMNLLSNWG